MKTTTVSLIILGMGLSGLLFAESDEESDRPERRQEERRRAFTETWKQADTDGDGLISREEFAQMPRLQKLPEDKRQKLFQRLDKDGDGQMGKDEIHGIIKDQNRRPNPMQRIWELDKDKSGGVSLEEFREGRMFKKLDDDRQRAIFDRLDSDGDGFVTPQDKPQRPRDRGENHRRMPPPMMLRKMDKDQNGSVSFEEFQQLPGVKNLSEENQRKRFERADKNKDGSLTNEDFPPRKGRDGNRPDRRPDQNPDSKLE